MQKTPLFIFSAPRSGSTLLQRILATHPGISTVSESHILLPFLYLLREEGTYSEYDHKYTYKGFQHFMSKMQGGEEAYFDALRPLILELYDSVSDPGSSFFLDKAGAYSMIVEEIFRLFPDAKFVFLWRNPLSIIASLLQTWRQGRWIVHEHEMHLYAGIPRLVKAFEAHRPLVHSVNYESLIDCPVEVSARIFDYLGLEPSAAAAVDFAEVKLQGGLGDQPGMRRYKEISQAPLEKWKATLANPLRKAWCRRYLAFLGEERLRVMGYDSSQLMASLAEIPLSFKYFPSDLFRMPYGALFKLLEGRILRDKLRDLRAGRRSFMHS